MSAVPGVQLCMVCFHPVHTIGTRCTQMKGKKQCKCKGKPGFWFGVFSGLGNAIGESLFGGNR